MNKAKKIIFWGSLVIIVIFFSLFFLGPERMYPYHEITSVLGPSFLILCVVFPFSLVTYFLRDEVFQIWMRFSRWWIPMTIFLTIITPSGNGLYAGVGGEITAMFLGGIYTFVSAFLIIVKSVAVYRK